MNDPLAYASAAAILLAVAILIGLLVQRIRKRRHASRWVRWRMNADTGEWEMREMEDWK